MNLRSNRLLLIAAAIGVALVGAGIGAGIYSAVGPGGTTTVVNSVTVDRGQQIAATTGLTVTQIYQQTYRGVVDITVGERSSFSFGRGGGQAETGEGSGFVYNGKGDIVTNDHVVDGATSITVKFWNGASYKGHVVGTDPSTDLAVVKISAPSLQLHPLTLGDSSRVQVGAGVVAIGSPFGYAESVTSGIISALHRTMTSPNQYTIANALQTDAPINHGNSGGPLLDAQGHVIGVNSQIQSNSGGSDGVGFSIPSDTIAVVAADIVAGKKVQHAYLGVSLGDTTQAGALIGGLTTGGPAAKAKLHCGDVITAVDGQPIAAYADLTSAIDGKRPGDTVTLTYKRNGSTHTTHVVLGTRPNGDLAHGC